MIKPSQQRSYNMSRIKNKDTSIEIKVRKYLFAQGFRFRKNDKRLPGTPDVVLPKYRTVIFIHGCFWHRHPFCAKASTPSTNTEFWVEKFDKNVENDNKNYKLLENDGWKVIIIWQCELDKKNFENTMNRVVHELYSIENQAGN